MQAVEDFANQFIKGYELERAGGNVVVEDYMGESDARRGSMSEQLSTELPSLDKIIESTLNESKYRTHFSKMRTQLEKMIKTWNDDPTNRDQTVTTLQNLTESKDDIQENLRQMLERDGKLQESLVRSEQISSTSTSFKKRAKQVKT